MFCGNEEKPEWALTPEMESYLDRFHLSGNEEKPEWALTHAMWLSHPPGYHGWK